MAASIPERAKRYAFSRDKKEGVARGIRVVDVVSAVNDLWTESQQLEHSFALQGFREDFLKDLKDKRRKRSH